MCFITCQPTPTASRSCHGFAKSFGRGRGRVASSGIANLHAPRPTIRCPGQPGLPVRMSEYKVKFEVFEGPLDLLLYLIKKEEVDIYEVNLTKLATQFIEYIDLMREFDLEIAGEFLVMASTLMYIKSRELLPVDQQVQVEQRGGRRRPALGTHPAARRIQEIQGRRRATADARSPAGRCLPAPAGQTGVRQRRAGGQAGGFHLRPAQRGQLRAQTV